MTAKDKDLRARQAVLEMGRVELEDKHLGLVEENFILKKHARSQEEKMKKMATKLLRLTADERKVAKKAVHPLSVSQLRQRDIETEDLLRELHEKVVKLEQQNASLASKNQLYRQQVEAYARRRTPYDHVPGKLNTGLKKKTPPPPAFPAVPAVHPKAASGSSFRPVQGSPKAARGSGFRPVQGSPKVSRGSNFRPVQGSPKVSRGSSFRPVQGSPQASSFQPVQEIPNAAPEPSFQPVQGAVPGKVHVGVQFSGTCHNLLQGIREDNQELEDQLLQLRAQLLDKEAVINSVKEKLRLKSMQLEEEKLTVRQEWQAQVAALESEKTDQEVEAMKLQREARDSSHRLQMMRTKCAAAENNLEAMKNAHSKLLDEMEGLNADLKRERDKVARLELKASDHGANRQSISHLEVMVEDLRRERDSLREVKKGTDQEEELHVVQYKARVATLQEQVRILEEAAKTDNTERSKTLKELATERDLSSGLDADLRKLRDTYNKLKKEYDQVKEKLKFFEKESSLDWSEVEEALVLVREGKNRSSSPTAELTKAPDNDKELQELRVFHADTVNELEKTRKLLQVQHSISKDYKAEVESVKRQLAEHRQQQDGRLKEYAQLIDIKAARVKKLEGQLKEIAYGTKSYRVDTSKFEYGEEMEDGGPRVELERGQNLLEFNISQVILSPEALSCLVTSSPALFLTCNFMDYETHVTPVLQGPRPNFGYTASFVVGVDDTFLQHLQRSCIQLELNQATGFKYHLLSVASVKCWEVVASSGGKVHGKTLLTGVDTMQDCVNVGSVDYWMRLKLPVTQAAKLYQDRAKALAFVDSMRATPTAPPTSLQPSRGPDYNELSITIVKCQGLPTKNGPVQFPSPYVMYKLYSFPDHDTATISHTSTPRFMDHTSFPVSMDAHLDQYLKTQPLELYVFDEDEFTDDDEDDDIETPCYMGVAQVPLAPLSHGKPVSGTVQLKQPSGESGGFIDISMKWNLPYTPQPAPSKGQPAPSKGQPAPSKGQPAPSKPHPQTDHTAVSQKPPQPSTSRTINVQSKPPHSTPSKLSKSSLKSGSSKAAKSSSKSVASSVESGVSEEFHEVAPLENSLPPLGTRPGGSKESLKGLKAEGSREGLRGKEGLKAPRGPAVEGEESKGTVLFSDSWCMDGKCGVESKGSVEVKGSVEGKGGIGGMEGKGGVEGKGGMEGKGGVEGKGGMEVKEGVQGKGPFQVEVQPPSAMEGSEVLEELSSSTSGDKTGTAVESSSGTAYSLKESSKNVFGGRKGSVGVVAPAGGDNAGTAAESSSGTAYSSLHTEEISGGSKGSVGVVNAPSESSSGTAYSSFPSEKSFKDVAGSRKGSVGVVRAPEGNTAGTAAESSSGGTVYSSFDTEGSSKDEAGSRKGSGGVVIAVGSVAEFTTQTSSADASSVVTSSGSGGFAVQSAVGVGKVGSSVRSGSTDESTVSSVASSGRNVAAAGVVSGDSAGIGGRGVAAKTVAKTDTTIAGSGVTTSAAVSVASGSNIVAKTAATFSGGVTKTSTEVAGLPSGAVAEVSTTVARGSDVVAKTATSVAGGGGIVATTDVAGGHGNVVTETTVAGSGNTVSNSATAFAGGSGVGNSTYLAVERGAGGGGGGYLSGGSGGSLSMVSVTELSGEGDSVEEELEEELEEEGDDEDTMFEETLHGSDDSSSGLSEHSSDLRLSELRATHPPTTGVGGAGNGSGSMQGSNVAIEPVLSDARSKDSNPITSKKKEKDEQKPAEENTMSITIHSFTLEPGCSLAVNPAVGNIFIEYQFLSYDSSELETSSLPKPQEGGEVNFHFRKDFVLDSEKLNLLAHMLNPGDPTDGEIAFTMVSDPEEQEADCEELGTATLDINMILKRGQDIIQDSIDVMTLEEDPEVIGYITVSVEALELLRTLEH